MNKFKLTYEQAQFGIAVRHYKMGLRNNVSEDATKIQMEYILKCSPEQVDIFIEKYCKSSEYDFLCADSISFGDHSIDFFNIVAIGFKNEYGEGHTFGVQIHAANHNEACIIDPYSMSLCLDFIAKCSKLLPKTYSI